MSDDIRFSTVEPDDQGNLVESNIRIIMRSDILACPQIILLPEHYREDGSCRCDEGKYDDEGNFVLFKSDEQSPRPEQ